MTPASRAPRICLFGAAGDTGNLGVSALMHATLAGIVRAAPEADVTVFDNGWGVRAATTRAAGRELCYRRIGARLSRRYHRRESFANMRFSARLGGLGNPGVRHLQAADEVWDVSGGDSFADLYGARHLRSILAPKRLALALGKPLVLLPQTYGPFRTPSVRDAARRVVLAARTAWSRDERGHDALHELLGPEFDEARHRSGVDLAFALETHAPAQPLPDRIATWFAEERAPLVGLNVSGLLWNDATAAERYGLSVDYRELMTSLVRRFLEESEANVLLIPHVIPTENHGESDVVAGEALAARFEAAERVARLPAGYDQSETKHVLAGLDWFAGARMHATIGALSSLVPTCGHAYSLKMQGVFETCGLGSGVVDLRTDDTARALEGTWASWEGRAEGSVTLAEYVPAVRERASWQLEEILRGTRA